MVDLSDRCQHRIAPSAALGRRKLEGDVFDVVGPEAPVAVHSAAELSVDEQVLQHLAIAEAPLQLRRVRANQRVGLAEHEHAGRSPARLADLVVGS